MPELRIAEFREILEDRDRLKTENESQRRTITALEKEARRAATLERELGRERSRHEVAKSRAKERMAEAGAYEAKLREAKADFRAISDELKSTQDALAHAEQYHQLYGSMQETEAQLVAEIDKLSLELRNKEAIIERLKVDSDAYHTIKGALK